MSVSVIGKRPLPDFQRWLDQHGHTERAEDFDALNDLAERTQRQSAEHLDANSKSLLRMWQGFSIAVVELCNMERQHGRNPSEIIALMPRALALAAFYSVASALPEETPWRSIVKILVEEFRFGAKEAADQYTESLDARESE